MDPRTAGYERFKNKWVKRSFPPPQNRYQCYLQQLAQMTLLVSVTRDKELQGFTDSSHVINTTMIKQIGTTTHANS